MRNRRLDRVILGLLAAVVAAAGAATTLHAQRGAPRYEADLSWPKPLPNNWVLGTLGGVCVSDQDHVVIVNRQDVPADALDGGTPAPPIIEFDVAGNVVRGWGDPNILDNVPRLHDCHFDGDGNIWIASATSGVVQKFAPDGSRLLLQVGQKGRLDTSDGTASGTPLNSAAATFMMPASIWVDRANGDVYVADGEGTGNLRIAVMNREGRFLRHWLPQGMVTLHCMTVANDGTIYACNRTGSEIRLFDKMGGDGATLEVPWDRPAPGPDGTIAQDGGAVADLDFSADPEQRLIFVINQNNMRIEILERSTGRHLGYFGTGGTEPGQLDQAHALAVDSNDNIFVADQRGRRVQKFTPVR